MKKTFFEIRINSAEIRGRVDGAIYHGCICDEQIRSNADCGGELVARYDEKEEALAALSDRETMIREFGYHFFFVEEFFIEENTYDIDEDGDEEWIEGGDVWGYSAMPDELSHDHKTYRWNEKFGRYVEIEEDEEE